MKKYLYLALSLLLLNACGPETRETENIEDTEISEDEFAYHNAVYKQAKGHWQGKLPCADCPGVQYSLTLFPDSTFREEMVYEERNVKPFTQTGTWQIMPDSVVSLSGDDGKNSRIQLSGNSLIKLDQQGEKITGALAENYRLKRSSLEKLIEENDEVWQDKQQEGIDFIAIGSEPDWLLEIDNEKMMTFTTQASAKLNLSAPVIMPERLGKGDTIIYTTQTEIGTFEVIARKQECKNPASDKNFAFAVEVRISGKPFEGCGMYLNDNRIAGKWELQMLNNQVVKQDTLQKVKPFIEFSQSDNKVFGHAGCNRFSGTVTVEGSKLIFSPIISTKMACPEMKTEQDFMKVLSSKNLTFTIDPDRLTFRESGKPVAIFRKFVEPEKEETPKRK